MEPVTLISPRSAFDRHASLSPEEERRLREEMRLWQAEALQQERMKKLKKEHEDEKRHEAEFVAAMQIVLATQSQIDTFTIKLDRYDTATVEALLANEQDLKIVTDRIEKMLGQAEQLPDGRRVFKTEDGTRVFDEHGKELAHDEIDPAAIDDSKIRFEPYWASRMEQEALTKEREDILKFQQKLDDARETVGKEGLKASELEELERELDKEAPERVRQFMGDDPANDRDGPAQQRGADHAFRSQAPAMAGPAGP